MCIFNEPVEKVSGTKILVFRTTNGRQITIYENAVTSLPNLPGETKSANNAMILPAPFKDTPGNNVEFLDLKTTPTFFEDLNHCFPEPPMSRGMLNSFDCDDEGDKTNFLQVHAVGAYNMSFARNLADLDRIDPKFFKVSALVAPILAASYKHDFGFVICAFDSKKNIEPHPIGFIHDTFKDGKLFVPTKHEHGSGGKKDLAHFDHKIFSINTDAETAGSSPQELFVKYERRPYKNAKSFLGSTLLSKFLPVAWTIRRLIIEEDAQNEDVILTEVPEGTVHTDIPEIDVTKPAATTKPEQDDETCVIG
jgi:hypothetical protein